MNNQNRRTRGFLLLIALMILIIYLITISGCEEGPVSNNNSVKTESKTYVISYKNGRGDTSEFITSDKQVIQGGYINIYNENNFIKNIELDSIINAEN